MTFVALAFGDTAIRVRDGAAQTTPNAAATADPGTKGFRLVARVLPAE